MDEIVQLVIFVKYIYKDHPNLFFTWLDIHLEQVKRHTAIGGESNYVFGGY